MSRSDFQGPGKVLRVTEREGGAAKADEAGLQLPRPSFPQQVGALKMGTVPLAAPFHASQGTQRRSHALGRYQMQPGPQG